VAIGMTVAAALSVEEVGLAPSSARRLQTLLHGLGLPTADPDLTPSDVARWFVRDKKRAGGETRFVLTPRIGSASFGHLVTQSIVMDALARFLGGGAA